jgi:hypothetical protein
MILLWDIVRVAVAAAGLAIGAHSVYMGIRVPNWGQRCRFFGLSLLLLIVCGSRVQNLGAPVTWQLLASVIAIGVLAYGSLSFRNEVPVQRRDQAI